MSGGVSIKWITYKKAKLSHQVLNYLRLIVRLLFDWKHMTVLSQEGDEVEVGGIWKDQSKHLKKQGGGNSVQQMRSFSWERNVSRISISRWVKVNEQREGRNKGYHHIYQQELVEDANGDISEFNNMYHVSKVHYVYSVYDIKNIKSI